MKKPTIKIVKFYQSLDPSSCMRVKVGSVEGKYSELLTNYKRKKKSQITRSQDISIFFSAAKFRVAFFPGYTTST